MKLIYPLKTIISYPIIVGLETSSWQYRTVKLPEGDLLTKTLPGETVSLRFFDLFGSKYITQVRPHEY